MLHEPICLVIAAGTYCGVLPDPDPLAAQPPVAPAVETTVTIVEESAPPDLMAVQRWLRVQPAETLIRIAWAGTGQEEKAVAIARRESGLRCDARNRRSSASGLFQHLRLHEPRAARMGFSWAEVAGPDCLADVMLARQMWAESGWRPWRLTA